jgi:acetyl-CoA carboxylase beta subunit
MVSRCCSTHVYTAGIELHYYVCYKCNKPTELKDTNRAKIVVHRAKIVNSLDILINKSLNITYDAV